MPYIPKEHRNYPVLLRCRAQGGEVFQYDSELMRQICERIGEAPFPYGYNSYEEYDAELDRLVRSHEDDFETVHRIEECRNMIHEANHKEDWSICRWLGEDCGLFGLRRGGCYYWPCSAKAPRFGGVIDEEEFTAYLYPTDPDLWEILVDPTGMAHRTIYGGENATVYGISEK